MDCTDLLQDVSYHLSHNLNIAHLRETVWVYFLRFRLIPLSVIGKLRTYFFCFIVKSILEHLAAILLYAKTTSHKLVGLSVTEAQTKVQIGTQKNGGLLA